MKTIAYIDLTDIEGETFNYTPKSDLLVITSKTGLKKEYDTLLNLSQRTLSIRNPLVVVSDDAHLMADIPYTFLIIKNLGDTNRFLDSVKSIPRYSNDTFVITNGEDLDSIRKANPYAKILLDIGNTDISKIDSLSNIHLINAPLCLEGSKEVILTAETLEVSKGYTQIPSSTRILGFCKTRKCQNCLMSNRCYGIPKDAIGKVLLKPIEDNIDLPRYSSVFDSDSLMTEKLTIDCNDIKMKDSLAYRRISEIKATLEMGTFKGIPFFCTLKYNQSMVFVRSLLPGHNLIEKDSCGLMGIHFRYFVVGKQTEGSAVAIKKLSHKHPLPKGAIGLIGKIPLYNFSKEQKEYIQDRASNLLADTLVPLLREYGEAESVDTNFGDIYYKGAKVAESTSSRTNDGFIIYATIYCTLKDDNIMDTILSDCKDTEYNPRYLGITDKIINLTRDTIESHLQNALDSLADDFNKIRKCENEL